MKLKRIKGLITRAYFFHSEMVAKFHTFRKVDILYSQFLDKRNTEQSVNDNMPNEGHIGQGQSQF